jgi:hypothetical protein
MRSFQLRLSVFCVSFGAVAALVGCSGLGDSGGSASSPRGSDSTVTGGTPTDGTGSGGASDGTGSSSAGGSTGSGGSTGTGGSGTGGGGGRIQAGTLTAGTWDDNLNFAFYLPYLKQLESEQIDGLPIIPRAGRLAITVTDPGGAPVGNAVVTVSDAGGQLLKAPTRPDGKLFFFPGVASAQTGDGLQIRAALGTAVGTASATVGDDAVTVVLPGVTATTAKALDLALVIDTTGSMGDELAYLQVEVNTIASQVAQFYPDVAQRLALILYRDTGDLYVVRPFDFTASLSTFQAEIAAQSAEGGGDWPESPEKGLAALTQLSWRTDAVARMAFWIGDAPHHAEWASAMVSDFLAVQAAGIRLYPISASGTDDLLEYTMRTGAEVTGGRYLFLTNDSGIGNDHKAPTIPCYQVTSLDKAMLRMISMELTGTEIEPVPEDVIRTSGDPHDGTCLLPDGQKVCAL